MPWTSWGMMLGDTPLLLGGTSRTPGLCPGGWGWGGCGKTAAGNGEGVPISQPRHGVEPVGAELPCLQERQGTSSSPAPPSSYFLPNTTLVFHTEGKAGVE